jgi:hypothetical protein
MRHLDMHSTGARRSTLQIVVGRRKYELFCQGGGGGRLGINGDIAPGDYGRYASGIGTAPTAGPGRRIKRVTNNNTVVFSFCCIDVIILEFILRPFPWMRKNTKEKTKKIVIFITRVETVILQVRARFVGRGTSRGKTISSHIIRKKISVYNLFKAKDNNFY